MKMSLILLAFLSLGAVSQAATVNGTSVEYSVAMATYRDCQRVGFASQACIIDTIDKEEKPTEYSQQFYSAEYSGNSEFAKKFFSAFASSMQSQTILNAIKIQQVRDIKLTARLMFYADGIHELTARGKKTGPVGSLSIELKIDGKVAWIRVDDRMLEEEFKSGAHSIEVEKTILKLIEMAANYKP